MGSWLSTSAKPEQIAQAAEKVKQLVESSEIAIFSKSYCPYCLTAKGVLGGKGVSSSTQTVELDLKREGTAMQAALAQLQGKSHVTVPQIYIKQRLVGGCSDLLRADKDGSLDRMLADIRGAKS